MALLDSWLIPIEPLRVKDASGAPTRINQVLESMPVVLTFFAFFF
jgi:hypothetical protein